MKVNYLISLLFFCSFFSYATLDSQKQVFGAYVSEDESVNLFQMYGSINGEISVFFDNIQENVMLNVVDSNNGQTIPMTIPARQLLNSALSFWTQSGIFFSHNDMTPPVDVNHAGIVTRIRSDPPNQTGSGPLGFTNFTRIPSSNRYQSVVNISTYSIERSGLNNYHTLRNANEIDMTQQEFIEATFLQTAIHEIGHALGLGHPDGRNGLGWHWSIIVPPTIMNSRPSIMLSGLSEEQYYFRVLSRHLHRPVMINDVRPSNNDIRGVRLLRSGTDRRAILTSAILATVISIAKGSKK